MPLFMACDCVELGNVEIFKEGREILYYLLVCVCLIGSKSFSRYHKLELTEPFLVHKHVKAH